MGFEIVGGKKNKRKKELDAFLKAYSHPSSHKYFWPCLYHLALQIFIIM